MSEPTIDFELWLRQGFDNGFIGPPVCFTHDGLPTTAAEDEEYDTGDPCLHVIRLYDCPEMRADVEANHSPSRWRASNRGLTP